jgi:hypothetical protein
MKEMKMEGLIKKVQITRDNSEEIVNLVHTQEFVESINTEESDTQGNSVNKIVKSRRTSTRTKKTPTIRGSDFLW